MSTIEEQPPHSCAWEPFCAELPALHERMEELACLHLQVSARMESMDQRDQTMAAHLAALATRTQASYAQLARQEQQLSQILEAMSALGGTPSGFVGLSRDLRGFAAVNRRLWKFLVALAAGIATLWGVLHLVDK